jgi:hypothetical protein
MGKIIISEYFWKKGGGVYSEIILVHVGWDNYFGVIFPNFAIFWEQKIPNYFFGLILNISRYFFWGGGYHYFILSKRLDVDA